MDRKRSPFNGTYYTDRATFYRDKNKYKELLLLPVVTKFAEEQIQASNNFDDVKLEQIEALQETSRYFINRFKASFQSYKQHPIKVIETPNSNLDYLTIEIAITELVPTEAAVNFISTIAGFFIPGTGIIKTLTKGSIAFEAIIRDGRTKDILIEIRDRQSDRASVFTFKDFDQFGHQRAIIDDWCDQFAQLAATDDSVTVEESLPFIFNPL